ncbi:MAG TPA: TIGR03621 family F420-dependent LLM class oxidoreductase [Myxococcota bacterium]|nr:TIGR03621 family F420-dependent LLM class oxidoreductase [Myxococcota bacterium]
MARPFRFGVQIHDLPRDGWSERVQRIEALGYSSVFCPDHFGVQWDPTVLITAAAAVTRQLKVGSLVYDVDYRHPVILAKAAAAVHLVSGGRHEFGIGAGWMQTDYEQAGMTYDRPGVRIERLAEALEIIRSMWTQERTSFTGKHYQIKEVAQAAKLPKGERPKILIGGGGPRVLRLAGRHADIVGINPSMHEGKITPQTAVDLVPERVQEKIEWVREGAQRAGRSFAEIELNSLVFVVAIADDVRGLRSALAKNTGMSESQVAACPIFLTGSPAEIREKLEKQREQSGISYIVIQGDDVDRIERFSEAVVRPLSGK